MKRNSKSAIFIFMGSIGYLICLMADFLLEILPGGLLVGDALTNYDKLVKVIGNAPAQRFALSGEIGVISMVFIALGMYGIFTYLSASFPKVSYIILIFGITSAVMGAVYHIICTTSAWYFVNSGLTQEAFNIYQSYIADHTALMLGNAVAYSVMALTLFLAVILKKTPMPRWMCIFNVVLIYFILSVFNIPGSTSIGGFLMCTAIGVFVLVSNEEKAIND